MYLSNRYYLISLPLEEDVEKDPEKIKGLKDTIKKHYLKPQGSVKNIHFIKQCYFKTDTLDSLISVSDLISDLGNSIVSLLHRSENGFKQTIKSMGLLKKEELEEPVLVDDISLAEYFDTFEWNNGKYNLSKPPKELYNQFLSEYNKADQTLKQKMEKLSEDYNTYKSIERQHHGGILSRTAESLYKEYEDMLYLKSDYMDLHLVAMKLNKYDEWLQIYERLSEMVVPRSSQEIARDKSGILVSVIVFKKYSELFKNEIRARGFILKESTKESLASFTSISEYEEKGQKLYQKTSTIYKMIQITMGELAQSLIHIRYLEIFVESVLNYGLPASYIYVQLDVKKGSLSHAQKLKKELKLDTLKLVNDCPEFRNIVVHKDDMEDNNNGTVNLSSVHSVASRDYMPFVHTIIE